MDWKEIKDKYPKSWDKLCDYHENEVVGLIDHPDVWDQYNLAPSCWELRHLYDFFDENELWIETSAQAINSWSFDIFKLTEANFECIYSENNYELLNRQEAEAAAFTKAFEVLEDKS